MAKQVASLYTFQYIVEWFHSSGPENKIVYFLYKYLYNLPCNRLLTNPWLDCIQKIFNTSGAPNIRHEQGHNINVKWITSIIKQTLQDQFIQKWFSDVNNSSKGQMYRICKQNFGFENYLNKLSPKIRNMFLKFPTTNHRLPVEIGRWQGTPLVKDFVHYVTMFSLLMSFTIF